MTEKKKTRSLGEYLQTTSQVKVYVGPDRIEYTLNEELLCDRVDYFRGAFQSGGGGFIEGQEKSIHLVEEDPGAFNLLVYYVYSDVLRGKDHFVGKSWFGRASNDDEVLQVLYPSGQVGHVGIAGQLSFVVARVRGWKLGHASPTGEELKFVYENTSQGSELRKRVVETAYCTMVVPHHKDPEYQNTIDAVC